MQGEQKPCSKSLFDQPEKHSTPRKKKKPSRDDHQVGQHVNFEIGRNIGRKIENVNEDKFVQSIHSIPWVNQKTSYRRQKNKKHDPTRIQPDRKETIGTSPMRRT
eukprot:TRINITY_DN222_c0_g1_i15.p3 TRINITY_DN222_c0_g1~~TRINITY_DN222_c0_g1_i15.p3  ORF type:complete len:105 (-),score=19.57 TRINITY_DN222_c0_g1_i15:214-528(-)